MSARAWDDEELRKIGAAEELGLASVRRDGTLRAYVVMWVVPVGGQLYVRSAYGAENPWYRRALRSKRGRVRAGGLERDVAFEAVDPAAGGGLHEDIDATYHAKYDRYGPAIVGTVVGEQARAVTIRLAPVASATGAPGGA